MASEGVRRNEGGPFGAIVVDKLGKIVGRGANRVTSTQDPTAHAEIVAIRDACSFLNSFKLEGLTMYSSSEPCPMCMAAIYWARLGTVIYSNTKAEAAKIGFDDLWVEKELELTPDHRKLKLHRVENEACKLALEEWVQKQDKVAY